MSEPNKGSRSLRPRAKLKRPEYYSSKSQQGSSGISKRSKKSQLESRAEQSSESDSEPSGRTNRRSLNRSLNRASKSDRRTSSSGPSNTTSKKRKVGEVLGGQSKGVSGTVGGCTSLNSGRNRGGGSQNPNPSSSRRNPRMEQDQQRQNAPQTPNPSAGGAGTVPPSGAGTEQNETPSANATAPPAPAAPTAAESLSSVEAQQRDELRRLHEMLEQRGLPSSLFGSLGPRMQQILQRTMMPLPHARNNQIIEQLGATGIGALPALTELCQMLCMGTEDNLAGFNYRQAVPKLITHLKDDEVDVSAHAARALTYLLESLPRSAHVVADAIPSLLERVANISDDGLLVVAEQSISCLEKLSHRHARQILQARGTSQVICFLDFFSLATQRSALQIVVASMKVIFGQGEFELVKEAIPVLLSRLQSSDRRSTEYAIQAITKLVDKVVSEHDECDQVIDSLNSSGVVTALTAVVCDPSNVNPQHMTLCLRALQQLCNKSRAIQVAICGSSLPQALQSILTLDMTASPQRETQELIEAIKLAAALLPKESEVTNPCEVAIDPAEFYDDGASDDSAEMQVDLPPFDATSKTTTSEDPLVPPTSIPKPDEIADEAEKDPVSQEDILLSKPIVEALYPLCWKLLTAAPNTSLRVSVIRAVLRMSYSAEADTLRKLLIDKECHASSQIQQLLDSTETKVIVPALQLTRAILTLLPEFRAKFHREGLYHCLSQMSELPAKSATSAPASLATTPMDVGSSGWRQAQMPTGSKSEQRRNISAYRFAHRKGESSASSVRRVLHSESDTASLDAAASAAAAAVKTAQEQLSAALGETGVEPAKRQSGLSAAMKEALSVEDDEEEEEGEVPDPTDEELAGADPDFAALPIPAIPNKVTKGENSAKSAAETGSMSSTSTTLSGLSTPLTHANIFHKTFGARIRCDSTSRKEVELGWARDESKKILDEFFVEFETADEEGGTISKLKEAAATINKSDVEREQQRQALAHIAEILMSQDLSPFEMLHTDIITGLLEFILKSDENQREFLAVFAKLPIEFNSSEVIIPQNCELFIKLVNKLNQVISQVERYPVKLGDYGGSSSSRLQQLSQHHIKCHFQRDPSCSKTKKWTNGPVKIDPLAHVSAIERHLVAKGYGLPVNDTSGSGSEDMNSDTDDETPETHAASLSGLVRGQRLVELSINGKTLPPNITIYQAIREYDIESGSEGSDDEDYQNMIWGRTFSINYRIIPKESSATSSDKSESKNSSTNEAKPLSNDDPLWVFGTVSSRHSPLHKYFKPLPHDLDDELVNLQTSVSLMSCLFGLSRFWQNLYPPECSCSAKMLCEPEEFENPSITSKVWRQLQDPLCVLSGNIPSWLVELSSCSSFLLAFDVRRFLFYIMTFDRQRAIQKLLERLPEHDLIHQPGSSRSIQARVTREKAIVDRNELLKSAETLFDKTKSSNSCIEVQYVNEVGTGLGPTLEFYTLISHELRRGELGLWRGQKVKEENLKGRTIVRDSHLPGEGLFPTPLSKNCKKTTVTYQINKFKLFGRLLARAVKDSRMLDLPLSELMCRVLLSEEDTFSFRDLFQLDSQLARSLQQLHSFAANDQADNVEELYLDFILPGHQNIELLKGGKNKPVLGRNLEQYIDLVAHWSMVEGVRRQFQAMRAGFNELFDIKKLKIFHPWELPRLFCGSERARWTVSELESAIRPDHGYTQNCRSVQFLYTVLSELNNDEQADFLRFTTGSPHLPVGGLKALNPPLTVVKKTVGDGEVPENYLPSVMTCQNYLKLPDYPSLQVMREKLMVAISDGQGAFLLS